MELQHGNIKLRKWMLSDADHLAGIANNKRIFNNLRDGFPYPYFLDNAKEFIGYALTAINEQLFAITCNNLLIGSCGIMFKTDVYRYNAEIGYFIGEPFWGNGYATDTIIALRDYIFNNLDIIRVYAEPFADNLASRRALEKSGFQCEAIFEKNVVKNNIVKDSCIYSVLKQ